MEIYIFGFIEGLIVFTLGLFENQRDIKIRSRNNSTLHALVTSSFAILYINNIISLLVWSFIMGFSAGYAVYEMILLPCLPEIKLDKATIAHHIMMAYSTTYYSQYPEILAYGFLTEISTIFLNVSYIELKENGRTKNFQMNAFLTLFTFFIFRIIMLWAIVYNMFISNNYIGIVVGSLFGILNLFWFVKLIKVRVDDRLPSKDLHT